MRFILKSLAVAGMVSMASTVAFAATAPAPAASAMPGVFVDIIDGRAMSTPDGMSLYENAAENRNAPNPRWVCGKQTNILTMNDQQSGIGVRPIMAAAEIRGCIDKYRPYVAAADAKPVGEFDIAVREDGTRQWTFRGSPLYLANRDQRPGHRFGVGNGMSNVSERRVSAQAAAAAAAAAAGGRGGRGGGQAFGGGGGADAQFPAGLRRTRWDHGVFLTIGNRPAYIRKDNVQQLTVSAMDKGIKPVLAAGLVNKIDAPDFTLVDTGIGQKQYAYKGKLLFDVPADLNDTDEDLARQGFVPYQIDKPLPRPAAIGKHITLQSEVYTDRNGMTLYTYNAGAVGDESGDPSEAMVALCGTGAECARRWKPYLASADDKPAGEFDIIDITYPMFDDMKGVLYPQHLPKVKVWAYRGRPLFTYTNDQKPGDNWGANQAFLNGSSFGHVAVPGGVRIDLGT